MFLCENGQDNEKQRLGKAACNLKEEKEAAFHFTALFPLGTST